MATSVLSVEGSEIRQQKEENNTDFIRHVVGRVRELHPAGRRGSKEGGRAPCCPFMAESVVVQLRGPFHEDPVQ